MKVALGSLCRWSIIAMCGVVLSASVFGQGDYDECVAIYNKFLENRKGPEVAKLQTAIGAGKEYLSKCGAVADNEKIRDYITQGIPKLEDTVQANLDYEALKAALSANDFEKSFTLGKKVLARTPDNVDIMLALALAGHDAALGQSPVDKFNDETLRYAKTALEKLNDPAAKTGYFKSTDCADGRATAVGWMNAVIGDLTWYELKDRKAALPYLYRSTQNGCSTKTRPQTFQLIGSTYVDEFQRLETDRLAKTKVAGDKDTDETKNIYALELGYLERMMDAYGRAYNFANADAKYDTDKKAALLAKTKEFYNARHEDNPAGFDDWLKTLSSISLPDPVSAVTPVVIPPPTATSPPK